MDTGMNCAVNLFLDFIELQIITAKAFFGRLSSIIKKDGRLLKNYVVFLFA
jgi:hypothetical protein